MAVWRLVVVCLLMICIFALWNCNKCDICKVFCAALTVTCCTYQNWVLSTWLRIPTSHNANRAVGNIALLHNTPLRGALRVDHVQARNQLGTPGVAKSFLRGAQLFKTMSNNFQLCPTHFSWGGEQFCRGGEAPLVTGLIMSWPSMFLFGSALLHANNPLKNVSSQFVLLCKKAAPSHFIQATPQLVLFALIGNFANKVACFSRIVSHPIAKSHVKPWSVRGDDTTWVRLFLPFVFEQLRLT